MNNNFKVKIREVKEIFEKHPREQGLSYPEHLQQTLIISMLCLICFVLFFVHAFFGMFFEELANDLLTLCNKKNDDIRFKNEISIVMQNGIVSK